MTEVSAFLEDFDARLGSGFAAFGIHQFLGTANELTSQLAVWAKPHGVQVRHLDVVNLTSDATNPASARAAIESALETLGTVDDRMLVTIAGVNVLASLYPGGLTQPINKWLRRGSRVIVLAVPPVNPLRLPESASVMRWREGLTAELGSEHTMTDGGA